MWNHLRRVADPIADIGIDEHGPRGAVDVAVDQTASQIRLSRDLTVRIGQLHLGEAEGRGYERSGRREGEGTIHSARGTAGHEATGKHYLGRNLDDVCGAVRLND